MGLFTKNNFRLMRCKDPHETRRGLRRWYSRFPGQWLLEDEVSQLSDVLLTLFGYHLLQVGVNSKSDCLASSKIPNQMVMDLDQTPFINADSQSVPRRMAYFRGTPEQLPIASDSLDVIVLSHTLEFSSNPHQILREVDRVLIPEGHVVILGFNPWGLWMLWRIVLGWREKPPWCGRFIGLSRLKDWLELLGFDIDNTAHYFFRPPIGRQRIMQKLQFMDRIGKRFFPYASGAYLVVGKKRVATLTPIKPRWRPRRSRLVAPELAGNSSIAHKDNESNNR